VTLPPEENRAAGFRILAVLVLGSWVLIAALGVGFIR
jgi:hypothetical protein